MTEVDEGGIHGFLHRPERPSADGLALTHGAGANCRSPLLIALAERFCQAGLTVLRYDLPFRQARPTGPPMRGSAERDQEGISRALEWLRHRIESRIFVGGHSYGGRQTSLAAASNSNLAAGLLLLSYPLHPPKAPTQLRTAHLHNLHVPALFFHGTRDGFGTIEEMRSALALIPAQTKLMPVNGAGHELLSAKNRVEFPNAVVDAFTEMFLTGRG